MFKSIFFKYFAIIAVILLASFVLLGSTLGYVLRTQWEDDKYELLQKNVNKVSEGVAVVAASEDGFLEQSDEVFSMVNTISGIIDAEIYIYDFSGEYVLCSHQNELCNHKNFTLDASLLEKVLAGNYSETGDMGGLYNQKCFTVSTPIFINGVAIGAVFSTVPMQASHRYVMQSLQAVLVYMVVVLCLAFAVIYIASARITRPLRLMAQAARKMEKGDFVQRIPVHQRDEVGLLAEAFNRMSKSLGSLELMRRSFISSVSHELKTPMTTISGFIDGILDGTIPPEDQDKYLQIVSDETKRLSRLVNSMLQLSRLENNEVKLSRSTFNVSDLIVRVMLSFEHKIDEKQLDIRGLDALEPVYLSADNDLIYQVIYNLVENAIKFTPEKGYISVLAAKNKHDDTVSFTIKNSGEGLSKVEMSRIFERFYKTDRSRSTDKTGVGFGLYIVKTIVTLHGGKIVVGSVLGEYTSFEVTLPGLKSGTGKEERSNQSNE